MLSINKPFEAHSMRLPPEVYDIDSHLDRASSSGRCGWRRSGDASVLVADTTDMQESEKGTLCSIYLLGCLTVIDAGGVNCTPRKSSPTAKSKSSRQPRFS